jgi:predicted hydrocarbon binding protein
MYHNGEKRDIAENILKKERADISWIVGGLGVMIQKVVEAVEYKTGSEGIEAINNALFSLGKEIGKRIKEEYNLDDSTEDMALVMMAHELRWGLKAYIAEMGSKRSVLRIEYCPFASKFGGPFSSPDDCLIWRNYALGLAHGVNEKIKFGEAKKKITKGDNFCEYIFELDE